MLSIVDAECRLDRRELLRIGTLGLGSLALPSLLSAQSAGGTSPLSGKSVIFLFQQGGPSQHETFDPKPDAPSGIRTVTDTVQTSLPGVHCPEKSFSKVMWTAWKTNGVSRAPSRQSTPFMR